MRGHAGNRKVHRTISTAKTLLRKKETLIRKIKNCPMTLASSPSAFSEVEPIRFWHPETRHWCCGHKVERNGTFSRRSLPSQPYLGGVTGADVCSW